MTIQKYLDVDHCRLCKAENKNNTHCYSSIPCSMGFLNNRHKFSGMFSKYLHAIVQCTCISSSLCNVFPCIYYNSMKKDAYDFVVINARYDILAKRLKDDCRYIFSEIFSCQISENRIFLLQGLQLLSVVLFFNLSHKLFIFSANNFSDFIIEETTLKCPMSNVQSRFILTWQTGRMCANATACLQMQENSNTCTFRNWAHPCFRRNLLLLVSLKWEAWRSKYGKSVKIIYIHI